MFGLPLGLHYPPQDRSSPARRDRSFPWTVWTASDGVCPDVVKECGARVPVLGVCLGMQVIATVAGATVKPSGHPVHGKASMIRHDGRGVLAGLPETFSAGRYHSLIVDPETVPESLEITSWSEDGTIMGCRMRGTRVEGVLFHPESF